jgi:peptidoglycan/LPS O-acetylase OafA/YrhL
MARPERPIEIKALSGARALPPLILVLYHFCEGHGYRYADWFDMPVGKGYLWVEFFFALSGFILIHVYGPKADDFRTGKAFVPFLRARLARLYPLHLFTLLSMLFLMWTLNALADRFGYVSIYHQPWPPINTWPSFAASLFLVQAWNLFPWLTWNGASWFVSVEFFLCLIFPLFVRWTRGGIKRALTLLAAGIAGLAVLALSSRHGLDLTFRDSVLRGLAGFSVGAALAMLYRRAVQAGAAKLPVWVFSAAQVAALGLLGLAIYGTGWSHSWRDIWTASAMFVLIFVLAFDRGFLARALSTSPLLKLGEWSYAIYMGQTFWLQLIRTIEQRAYPPAGIEIFGLRFGDAMWWAEPFILVGICILWGAILHRLIEKPANTAIRAWFAAGPIGRATPKK